MTENLHDLAEAFQGEAFAAAKTCVICGGSSKVLHPASNIHPQKPYQFELRSCLECGHGWIDPMPSQGLLDYLYAEGSRSVIGEWGEAQLSLPEQLLVRREANRPRARYFELGVGKGSVYRQFLSLGWKCSGVDPGDWAQDLPGIYRSLNEVPPETQADLIVAFDVLEHIADPVAVLRQLRAFAVPGAHLYCAMPNVQSFRARAHRENWRMVRPLGHVNYYSKSSISCAMSHADFKVKWLKASDLRGTLRIRRPSDILFTAVELLGLGDQWLVMAVAT